MQEVQFHLEVFEGPLQLLLHLIEKNKVNIADIPISLILEQYMVYVAAYEEMNVEQLSEFIAMASRLLYIKSRMLLPAAEDEEDPREEIVRPLEEYQHYRMLADELAARFHRGGWAYVREPELRDSSALPYAGSHDVEELHAAFDRATNHRPDAHEPRALQNFTEAISVPVVPVKIKIFAVLRTLLRAGQARFLSLFSASRSRSEIVATFLAVLELCGSQRVRLEEVKNDYNVILITGGRHGHQGNRSDT